MVLQALPDTTQDLEQKLSILHQELQPLENLKADVDQQAHRQVDCCYLGHVQMLTLIEEMTLI